MSILKSYITLGTTSFEITAGDPAENATELIPKSKIVTVTPVPYQERGVDNTDWTYPYDSITIIRLTIRAGKTYRFLDFELQSVQDQPTWSGGTLADLQTAIADINAWLPSGAPPIESYIVATGGTIIQIGDYKLHYGYGPVSGIFSILSEASNPANNDYQVELIAGGGGGSSTTVDSGGGGGGGAGGYILTTKTAVVGDYNYNIGNGGASDTNGQNSTWDDLTAIGGGAGKQRVNGNNGGSGGGTSFVWNGSSNASTGGTPTTGQGYRGGNSINATTVPGTGGGGASSAGGDIGYGNYIPGGNGGSGVLSLLGDYVCGGGGGGNYYNGGNPIPGTGGSSVGGDGSNPSDPLWSSWSGHPAVANTGSGGGGASSDGGNRGNGGSGSAGRWTVKYYSPIVETFSMTTILETQ